jgi:hypothetical protein
VLGKIQPVRTLRTQRSLWLTAQVRLLEERLGSDPWLMGKIWGKETSVMLESWQVCCTHEFVLRRGWGSMEMLG